MPFLRRSDSLGQDKRGEERTSGPRYRKKPLGDVSEGRTRA